MRLISYLIMLSFTVLSTPSFSGQWSNASKLRVTYVHAQHGGYGVFQMENMSVNPSNCTRPMYYVVSKVNNPIFDEIYSMLLAAHLSDSKVEVWLSGCSPHDHAEIQHARLVK